jgi:hypothetical protein
MAITLPEYEVARLYQNSLVIYKVIEFPPRKTEKQKENEKNLTRGQFNGYLSVKGKSRIKKILSPWLNSVIEFRKAKAQVKVPKRPYLTFVTLTLPAAQKHNDCEIKRVALNYFLINLQRRYNVQQYFWICETQKNGNLHFHIIVDSYIKWQSVRELWNVSIEKLGYVSAFEREHKHRNPNSTDIHKIQNLDSIESYVMKYVSKGGGERVIRGKIWDCSKDLKKLKPYETVIDTETAALINKISHSINFRRFEDEKITVFSGDILGFTSVHSREINRKLLNHWSECFKEIYLPKPKSNQDRPPLESEKVQHIRSINKASPQLIIDCPF